MSHFTVTVIGPDPEKQLLPFHEFECTGEEVFIQELDITEEEKEEFKPYADEGQSFLDYLSKNGHKPVKEGESPDIEDAHKYGYYIINAENEVLKVIRRTNPRKKWDWYSLGGRWSGSFKLKSGGGGTVGETAFMCQPAESGWVDQALKGDIDFDGMRNKAAQNAENKWRSAQAIFGDTQPSEPWATLRDRLTEEGKTIDEAKAIYAEQPRVLQWNSHPESRELSFWGFDPFQVPLEDYIKSARDAAGVTLALLKDDEWHERGSMGWWGIVSDEKDRDVWNAQFAALIGSLPDDTLLSVFDCHI